MSIGTQAGAEWRVLLSAALIGSGVGLALGAGYMAGGLAQAATDHARAERIAVAAAGDFSQAVLQQKAGGMDAGVLRLASAHDPFSLSRDDGERQSALLAAGLEQKQDDDLRLRDQLAAVGARPHSARDASRELDCLTQAVYFEARGETPQGQAAVAQVVLNRVKHPAFPKTVCGVVFQGSNRHTGCQFSFACDGSMRRGREASAWMRARKVAARALSGRVLADVGSATHFHTTAVAPAWGPQMRRVAQVGLHVFYKFNPRSIRSVPVAPRLQDHAIFASQTSPAGIELRLASAVAEKASDVAVSAVSQSADANVAKAPAKAADQPPAGLTKAADSAATPASATAEATVS